MQRNIIIIGKTKTYPKGDNDNDIDVIYAYENELEDLELAEQNGKTEYYVLISIKTNKTNHPDLELINNDWSEIAGGKFSELEFITEDWNKITKSYKYMFKEWHNETIRFKLPVVGYITDSYESARDAKKLLLKVATKRKWEFWK